MHALPKVQDVTIGEPMAPPQGRGDTPSTTGGGRLRRGESGERERADLATREVEHADGVIVGIGDEDAITGHGETTRLTESRDRGFAVHQSWLSVPGHLAALRRRGIEA